MSSQTNTSAQNTPASQPELAVDTAPASGGAADVPPEERDVQLPSPISPSALDFGLREPMKIEIQVTVEVEEVVESCLSCEVLDDFGVARRETVCRCSGPRTEL